MKMPKIIRFTDNVTCCDRCGKTELKGTFIVEDDSGQTYHLGRVCVGKRYELSNKERDEFIKSEKTARKNEAEARKAEIDREWNHSFSGVFEAGVLATFKKLEDAKYEAKTDKQHNEAEAQLESYNDFWWEHIKPIIRRNKRDFVERFNN